MSEAGGDRADVVLCVWGMKAVKDSAYSERKVSGRFQESGKEDLYFKSLMKDFVGFGVK